MSTTLTLKKRIALPPRAMTRVALSRSAATLREMQAPPVIVTRDDTAEVTRLRAELERVTRERDEARNIALEKAHREDRVKAITIREVNCIPEWEAKQPKARVPHITVQPERIITADVWASPPAE